MIRPGAFRSILMVVFRRPGSSGRARSCSRLRDLADFRLMSLSKEELSKIRAEAGAKGGKTVTPKKRAHLAAIASKGGKSLTPKKLEQITTAAIAGRKKVTPKKRADLSAAGAKGGQVVTEKKRAHLRKALAARWAKSKKKSAS